VDAARRSEAHRVTKVEAHRVTKVIVVISIAAVAIGLLVYATLGLVELDHDQGGIIGATVFVKKCTQECLVEQTKGE
jgi:hypothetical protein